MSIRELDKMERAVFLAIVEQSKLYPDEPFAYDVKAGQIYIINTLNVSIDRSEHMEIIRKLAEEDISHTRNFKCIFNCFYFTRMNADETIVIILLTTRNYLLRYEMFFCPIPMACKIANSYA